MAGRDDWERFCADARAADILAVAESLGAHLKNIATNEWAGPCPICGGNDRFSVNTRKGVFNCRGCGAKGSVIDLVMHITGCSVIEACERITGAPRPDRSRDETPEERQSRLKANARRAAEIQKCREAEECAEAERQERDREAIADVEARAGPIVESEHGMAYLRSRLLASASPRLLIDIRYVDELDYWGFHGGNGAQEAKPARLATLPAVIAVIRNADGAVTGYSATYLDPSEPKKWTPIGSSYNKELLAKRIDN
jgi:hypothetical protein